MKIGIVGLGLIGGSLAKSIKKNTSYSCFGYDIDRAAVAGALAQEAIDSELSLEDMGSCDVIIVCLHPQQTIDFISDNVSRFGAETIVIDTCGVKRAIIDKVDPLCHENGVSFVGCHPMAGREFSGFAYSVDNLFEKASFIMTPTELTPMGAVSKISSLAKEIGFARIVISNPDEHDRVIAFTSQLAHIVSSAYVKSPELGLECGFSGGSFQDMTRIATMNEDMWTDLFMQNRRHLMYELDMLIQNLNKYNDALKNSDNAAMRKLIAEGRELKEENLRHRVGQPN